MTLVEFALMAPLVFLLLLGAVVGGIFGYNYLQLSNAVRDGVRAAAVCGSAARNNQTQMLSTQVPTLPDGTSCTDSHLISYIQKTFQALPGNQTNLTITFPLAANGGDSLSQCQYQKTVEITASYPQPFYLPLIGRLLSNNGSGSSFTIKATAEATCEV